MSKTVKYVRFYNSPPPFKEPAVALHVNSKTDAQHALWRMGKKAGYYNEFDKASGKRLVNDFITAVKPPNK